MSHHTPPQLGGAGLSSYFLINVSTIFHHNIHKQTTAKYSQFLSNNTGFASSGCLSQPWSHHIEQERFSPRKKDSISSLRIAPCSATSGFGFTFCSCQLLFNFSCCLHQGQIKLFFEKLQAQVTCDFSPFAGRKKQEVIDTCWQSNGTKAECPESLMKLVAHEKSNDR